MTKKYDTQRVGKKWKRQLYGGNPGQTNHNQNLEYRNTAVRGAECG